MKQTDPRSARPVGDDCEAPTVVSRGAEVPEEATVAVPQADADAAATRVMQSSRVAPAPVWLERIEPATARGERLRLEARPARVLVGRAETSAVRLYSATASREHAEIGVDEAGTWWIVPRGGREIRIDGDATCESVPLEEGMNLGFGADRLRCTFQPARDGGTERSGIRGSEGGSVGETGRPPGWAIRGLVLAIGIAVGLVLLWLLLRRAAG